MCIVALALSVGCIIQLVMSEQVCSNFCSSLGMLESNPGKSCADIYQINKAARGVSRDYWVNTTTGIHQVYCDMELECAGYKGGWMRIADLDISRGDACPGEWRNITAPDDPTFRLCRSSGDDAGCYSTNFSINGAKYSKVCGKARAYQKGTTDGLNGFIGIHNIDGPYVDGISITLGQPRKHVWTYAIGYSDNSDYPDFNCPCAATPGVNAAASFVQNNYYCESGTVGDATSSSYQTNDPLWDGDECTGDNNNCCTDVGLPWFNRQFPIAQEEDIEVRMCHDQAYPTEGVLLDQLQLFVQ